MEALVLIGGFLFVAVLGYYVIGRLGRFLDRGGISPYWDAEEEEDAKKNRRPQPRTPSPIKIRIKLGAFQRGRLFFTERSNYHAG